MRYSEVLFGGDELSKEFARWYTNPQMNNGDNAAFHQHAPTLALLVRNKIVLELGMRYGMSTLGILWGKPKHLTSVDITRFETVDRIEELAKNAGVSYSFILGNDIEIDPSTIPPYNISGDTLAPDVTFFDTLHDYAQLAQELEIYAPITNEYMIFHDIVSFGTHDESNSAGKGLLLALEEFMQSEEGQHWETAAYYFNCNGLLILRRK
jgi:hypothetical protein